MNVQTHFKRMIPATCVLVVLATASTASLAQAQQPGAADPRFQQQPTFQYLFFWKVNDARTQSVLSATQQELGKLGETVALKQIGIKDPANAEVVDYYGVSRAPMPLVLCTATNGAVTRAFVTPFQTSQLREGIVSHGTVQSLKALQDNKLVVICAIRGQSAASQTLLRNALALKTDERFGKGIEVIAVDVRDTEEASLLSGLKLDASMAEPTMVILAPPGKQLATLTGAISTEQIAEKLIAAQNTCCPDGKCGPGGQCKPKKQ